MTSEKSLKVVICAEYQGKGAVEGSTTGFQRVVSEWINQSGIDNTVDVVVYCIGTENKKYNIFSNVTFKQYKPNLSIRHALPLIPTTIFPFLVDLLPLHPNMIQDILKEEPDVIHTFQTFGATDFSGYVAAKIMKLQNKKVRLINTVMGEIDTYFADYLQRIITYFYDIMDSNSLLKIIKDSARVGIPDGTEEGKVPLGKFLLYAPLGTFFYIVGKSFELVGNTQDFLVSKGKAILERLMGERYQPLENKIKQQINILREYKSASGYKKEAQSMFNFITKPMQLIYDFVRRGEREGPRVGLNGLLANAFRWFLEKEIAAYLNSCDGVTISRREDLNRYQIKTPVWEVPLACDLEKFKVYDPSINDFISRVNNGVELGNLSFKSAKELVKIVRERDIVDKRYILYVGRLSDEKNISTLMYACEHLLKQEGIRDRIHFIFVGAGYAAAEIENKLCEHVTVTGLVPNYLLPDIYNFIRQRHGFFVSASDTETYGITHEEATACGVPLVAMQKGTRGHFYCSGDQIGKFIIDRDEDIANTIDELAAPDKADDFIIALNGLCIPDYSDGLGLSKLSTNYLGKDSAKKSLLSAMHIMAVLPNRVITKMSKYASEFTIDSKLGWQGTWQLIKKVYVNDLESYDRTVKQKKHIHWETQPNGELTNLSSIKETIA